MWSLSNTFYIRAKVARSNSILPGHRQTRRVLNQQLKQESRDLKLIQLKDYETLSEQTVEIKRMLTVLIQKLTAES